jgi:hypothetical protein
LEDQPAAPLGPAKLSETQGGNEPNLQGFGSFPPARGAGFEPQVASAASLARAAEAARAQAKIAAEQAEAAKVLAEVARAAAAEAAVENADPLALAAAASVWMSFDGIPPDEDAQQVLAGGRGEWLLAGELPEVKLQRARSRVQADSAPDRWERGPLLRLPVCQALKDLGVAQGLGPSAKDLQAARTRTAIERLQWVARLGLSRPALCKLVSGSALAAGLYGAASHVYDSDTLSSMRMWVMHALYRGSHFAQVKLFMHLVLPSSNGDPWQVALAKGWHAMELIRTAWGEEEFWEVWHSPSKDGPLASFRSLVGQVGLAGSFEASAMGADGPWRRGIEAKKLLAEALQQRDLRWVSQHRRGLKGAELIDVGLARRMVQTLPAKGPREAMESVLVGDMVVRHLTKHWQLHGGRCQCELAEETVRHALWECPLYASHRQQCEPGLVSRLQPCQAQLGATLLHPATAVWRSGLSESRWQRPEWRSQELFVDGSGLQPKYPAVRVVGWAVVGLSNGRWRTANGWLAVGSTVTAGEAVAAARAVQLLLQGGRVITDCSAVYDMWHRIRKDPRAVRRGVSAQCWVLLAEALAQHPTAKCSWIRSHFTVEQAVAEGFPARWHHGNSLADEAAKEAALAVNISPQLLHQHRQHVEEAAKVVTVVAGIQLARLQARTRTSDGAALKVRRRQQPGLPRRLRPKGIKRKAAAAVMEAALGEAEAQPSPPACSVLLQAKEHELPGPAMARRAIEESPVPAAGIHDLRPVEPWPAMGSGVFKNGRLAGYWYCTRCSRKAADTSRALQLARSCCGGAAWEAAAGCHVPEAIEGGWKCTRCGVAIRPQHVVQASTQQCPVPCLSAGGGPWVEGELCLREVLGRVRAFRLYPKGARRSG